jgi:hypothetical protein
MVRNSTNNHFSPQLIEHKKKTTTYDLEIQFLACDRYKLVAGLTEQWDPNLIYIQSDYSWNFWPSLFKQCWLESKNISKSLVATVKLSKWWLQQGTFRSVVDIMTGTTSSGISYQMRDIYIYSIYRCYIYIKSSQSHLL